MVNRLDRPAWLAGTVAVAITASLVPWALPKWLALTPYGAVWILAGFAAISATLLGLLYAAAMFRGQHLAARLPSEIVGELFESPWHRGAFFRLVAVLISSVLALAPVTASYLPAGAVNAVYLNLLLLVITLLVARSGIPRVFDRRYPMAVVARLMHRVDDAYLADREGSMRGISSALASGVITQESDPFALIEQTCLRAVRDGDLTTAHVVLRALAARVNDYLRGDHHNTRDVLGWLGELYSLIGRRSLASEERTAQLILILISETLGVVIERKRPWHERIEFMESFRELRRAAIRGGQITVVKDALHDLGHLWPKLLAAAPAENLLSWRETPRPEGWKHNPDLENEWRRTAEWIDDVRRDIELLIQVDNSDGFGTGQFILEHMGHDVLRASTLGDRQKRYLLHHLIWAAQHTVLEALRGGRSEDYVRWTMRLDNVLDEHGFGDLVLVQLNALSEVAIRAAEAGQLPWILINHLSSEGRGYSAEGADERGMVIAETLGALAGALTPHGDLEMRNRYLEAASGLRSIAEWDKREGSKLREAVRRELEKFSEEEERLKAWHESIPARRRIPRGELHSTPWA